MLWTAHAQLRSSAIESHIEACHLADTPLHVGGSGNERTWIQVHPEAITDAAVHGLVVFLLGGILVVA
jgi:hypothetical protein